MADGLSPVSIQDVEQIVTAEPLSVSRNAKRVLWVMVIIGIASLLFGLLGNDAKAAWVSFQVNFTYWFMLAAASTCFAAVFHICNAQWSRPIRRIFESASNFFLISAIFLLILPLGAHELFSWYHHPVAGKELWLSPVFLYGRDILALLVLVFMGRRLVFLSVGRDICAIRGGLTGVPSDKLKRWQNASYDKYVSGLGKDAKQGVYSLTGRMGRLSPATVIAYAILMSLIAFDQIMSVDPHWFSTLFGAFFFMSAVYVSMAWGSIGVGFLRELHPLFRAKIERRTLHDLGKLLFGFGIFWAYLFWSHYLPIWYGNIPEETSWLITRLRLEPWHPFAWTVLGTCFFIPFLLGLSRDVKQVPIMLFTTGVIVASGIWLQQYLLFTPSVFPFEIPLSLSDLGVTLGFLGAFLLSCVRFLERVPLIPFGDLYAEV